MLAKTVDQINEQYDWLRETTRHHVDVCWTKMQTMCQNIYWERMHTSMEAEDERRRPGVSLELPLDSSLSFFDEYQIINGSPVFKLDACDERHQRQFFPSSSSHRAQDSALEMPVELERNIHLPSWLGILKSDKVKITCYTFSHDDQYVACGTTNGAVLVWDANRGSLFRSLEGQHVFAVADVAFARTDSSEVISVDLDGYCVKWNCKAYPTTFTRKHCAPSWDDSSYVGKELAAPALSNDGNYVAFPIYTYTEIGNNDANASTSAAGTESRELVPTLYSILFIFETQALTNDLTKRVDPLYSLPVKISEPYIVVERLTDLVRFSRTSCRLLMTVYELGKSYLILWPFLEPGRVDSFRLNGTRGQFSNDDRFIVTWHSMLTSMDMTEDSRVYVWDVESLEKDREEATVGWRHPMHETKLQMVLDDPNEGVVHSCDFIRIQDRRGLVSCCVDVDVTLIVWCLSTQTPLHVLRTDIPREDISPVSLRAMSASTQSLYKVHGMHSVATFRSGQWAGIFGSVHRRGIVWDAHTGVEVLRIDIPEEYAETQSGMDFIFSQTARKMLFVSRSRMLLWSPSILRGYNENDQPCYVFESGDCEIHMGESLCKFSADSSTIGLMRINGQKIMIWKFSPPKAIEFDRRSVTHETSFPENSDETRSFFCVDAARNRFCQFALSHNGLNVVACMGDMAVLLWHIDSVRYCTRIAKLSSNSCPALDVCFSQNPNGGTTIVVCQDQGVLIWIDLSERRIAHREATGASRSCKFTADGRTGVLMRTPHHVVVWDLVEKQCLRTLNYAIPILDTPMNAFSPQISPNGDYCLLGFYPDQSPIIAEEGTTFVDLGVESIWYPETTTISDDGQWALLSGRVDEEADDLQFVEQSLPDFIEIEDQQRFPSLSFFENEEEVLEGVIMREPEPERGKQTWRIVHLRGEGLSKQIRLPSEILASKFVALSPDGTRCAALNEKNELVVWGTHFTYNNILQQRYALTHDEDDASPESIFLKLNKGGPSLVNHAYEHGQTVVMECVVDRRFDILNQIFAWAIDSKIKLSFQGRIAHELQGRNETVSNAIDLAVASRSPDMVEVLLRAMMDEVTSVSSMAQILEQSIVKLSYHYPSLVMCFFKNPKLMRSQGKVRISEPYLRKQHDYLGVITDQRLVTSKHYIQRVWDNQQEEMNKHLPNRHRNNSTIEAETKVIPYPNIAKMGREGILQPLLFRRVQHFIFGSDLVRGVINYKFETYARKLLLEDLYHYLFLLVFFTGSCIFAGYERSFGATAGSIITLTLVAIVGLGNLIRFVKQTLTLYSERQVTYYLYDYMRWIEILSYLIVVFFVPIAVTVYDGKSEVVTSIMAVASVLIWVKMLYYAQAFKATGSMVVMIREIVKDIRWFLFLLVALLVGFGVAFFVLLGDLSTVREDKRMKLLEESRVNAGMSEMPEGFDPYASEIDGVFDGSLHLPEMCFGDNASRESLFGTLSGHVSLNSSDEFFYFKSPFESLLTVFLLMLSDISDILAVVYNSDGIHDGTKVVAYLLVVFFLAMVAIVLLNLLIAIMGDSFDRVKNHEKTLFLQRRAEVIQDVEMGLSEQRKNEINARIQRYLHILVPDFQTMEDSDWEGRLVDIQRRMRDELKEARTKGTNDLVEVKLGLSRLQKELHTLIRTLPLQELSRLSTTAAELERCLTTSQQLPHDS